MPVRVKEGALFFDDLPVAEESDQDDATLKAIHALAVSIKDLAGQQPQIDLKPILQLVQQIQASQERIIKCLKDQPKKCWDFHVEKLSNGNMTIEAKER